MRRSKLCLAPLAPLFATVVLVACSSSESSNDALSETPDAAVPVTAQSACEHEFRARYELCVKGNVAPVTMTSARTRYIESCVGAFGLLGSTRTPEELEACATAIEAAGCDVIAELLPECAPKAGTLATGSACNVDAQCQTGRCDLLNPLVRTKGCGVCVETVPEGDPCDPERTACAIGTFCLGSPDAPSRLTCKRARYVDADASCNGADTVCRPGLICARVDGAEPTCIPAFPVGQDCSDDVACAGDAFCGYSTGKCTSPGKEGDACDAQNPCAAGLGCDATTNKCAPLTFVEPGESCGGSVQCREGVCGQGTGAPRCPQIIEDGKGCLEGAHMTCRAPAACIGGACVLPTTATCQ